MRFRPVLAVCLVLAMAHAACFAGTPPPGWASAENYPKALEVAKRNGQMIAVMYSHDISIYYLTDTSTDWLNWMLVKPEVKSMIRIMAYVEDRPPFIADLRKQMGAADLIGVPCIFLVDQYGKLAGFAERPDKNAAQKALDIAAQVSPWIQKSDRQIATAQKSAAIGRYKAALKILEKVSAEDQKVTAAVATVVPQAEETGSKKKKAAGEKKPAPGSGDSSGGAPFAAPADGSGSADAKPDDLPPGAYYPDLVATNRTAYEAAANDRLKKAQDAFDQKDYPAVTKLLNVMVADRSDFDAVTQAADLLKQVEAAKKVKAGQ